MALVVTCPGCGKRYELHEGSAGKRARCKQCGREMRIPGAMPAAPARGTGPAAGGDPEGGPPPRRPAARGPRRRLRGHLPPLVKAGLILIGVLIGGTFVMGAGMAVASGRPELAAQPLEFLGFFACAGLAAVSGLKLVFMGVEEGTLADPLRQLLMPLFLPGFVARNWEDTKGPVVAYLAGIVGIVLWFVFVPPYLKEGGGAATGPGARLPGRDQAVELIVANVPSGEAAAVIEDRIEALADPGGAISIEGTFATGRPAHYRLWPVRDPRAFADRIAFGEVTRVRGREIRVTAAPIAAEEIASREAGREAAKEAEPARAAPAPPPGPPPDADPVTRALADLGSSDGGRRKQAVVRLAKLPPIDGRRAEVQHALRPLLDDGDGFLVNEVITAMVAWATPETLPALVPKASDDRFGVRWHAIEALGRLKDPRAAGAIADRLKDDGIKAEPALRALGPAAELAVRALLSSPDAGVRRAACRVLKDIGGPETLAFMRDARPDPDPGVRGAAQEAMRAIAARVGSPG